MADWIVFKDHIVAWIGVDRDALQVYAGLLLQLAAAALLRRPVSSLWPWLAVAAVEVANEAASIIADRYIEDWELVGSLTDLWVTMLVPTLLLLTARFAPSLLTTGTSSEGHRKRLLEQSQTGSPGETEFVDYVEALDGSWLPQDGAR